jgi:hypothetical protein
VYSTNGSKQTRVTALASRHSEQGDHEHAVTSANSAAYYRITPKSARMTEAEEAYPLTQRLAPDEHLQRG